MNTSTFGNSFGSDSNFSFGEGAYCGPVSAREYVDAGIFNYSPLEESYGYCKAEVSEEFELETVH